MSLEDFDKAREQVAGRSGGRLSNGQCEGERKKEVRPEVGDAGSCHDPSPGGRRNQPQGNGSHGEETDGRLATCGKQATRTEKCLCILVFLETKVFLVMYLNNKVS